MTSADENDGPARPPKHPVPQLQGPFEESMMESLNEWEDEEQKIDSIARRKLLLQGERYERVCAGRWKQRPGEKFHPLWKLSAQLSFGLHLLARGLAKSEEEVMRILQSHVDDIDGFLERTTEDFDLAQSDAEERLHYLRVPLEHVDVFDHMLEDKIFRTSIVEGNEKIEHIVERTTEAMKDALKDVQKGIDATAALGKYLTDLKSTWNIRKPDLDAVYVAMLGNVEGWTRAFMDLHLQGNRLAVTLVQLAGIVAEMQRRAGIASRKVLQPYSAPTSKKAPSLQAGRYRQEQHYDHHEPAPPRSPRPGDSNAPPNKPLPLAPDLMVSARQASRAKLAHEEKLRRRSLEVLREQDRTKATQVPSGIKASMAAKVRSVTKAGTAQTLSAKAKSPKSSGTRSSAPLSSPQGPDTGSASQLPTRGDLELCSPQNLPTGERDGAVELPAEMPRNGLGTRGSSRKGGLHLHLGPRHRIREHGSWPSSSKSFNIFRRSPPSFQHAEAITESHPAKVATPSPELGEPSSVVEDLQRVEIQPSAPPPQQSSPDPGFPTPPALISNSPPPRGADANAYTALPEVLATAQRATAVKAALKLSIPSSTDPELEKTPRATPSQLSESVCTEARPAEPKSGPSKSQAIPENDPEYAHREAGLGGPGPEVRTVDPVQVSEQQSPTAQDDEKTPTTAVKLHMEMPIISSPEAKTEPVEIETPLTSATMRSYSDFCKLPPQQKSPTPPPITPEEWTANQSIDSGVAPSVDPQKTSSFQEADTKSKPITVQPDEQPIPPSSAPAILEPVEKNVVDPKDLPKTRNKDLQSQARLLELIASTPPHSPIHARASSDASAPNADKTTSSAYRILAPPEEAPPPPAPGGRSMITPDYASAGAFDGERKSKRGSGLSTDGWKKIFTSGGDTPAASPDTGVGVMGVAEQKEEDEEIHMSANLMGGEGNDVLWYKGMGRDGLWISGG